RGFRQREPRAAVRLGDQRREPARLGQRLHERLGVAARFVHLLPVRAVELAAHGAHAFAEFPVIVGFGNAGHGGGPERPGPADYSNRPPGRWTRAPGGRSRRAPVPVILSYTFRE